MINQHTYDLKVAQTAKTLRLARGIKQQAMAAELNLERSCYSRLEKGERKFTIGQLYIVANVLGITLMQMIATVEGE